MSDSKQRPPERDGDAALAGLPPAKLRYVVRGYGFGRVRGGEGDGSAAEAASPNGAIEPGAEMGVPGLPPAKLQYIIRG